MGKGNKDITPDITPDIQVGKVKSKKDKLKETAVESKVMYSFKDTIYNTEEDAIRAKYNQVFYSIIGGSQQLNLAEELSTKDDLREDLLLAVQDMNDELEKITK